MKKWISTNTIRLAGPEKEFEIGSPSTTRKDPTSPWATKPLGRFSWKEKNQNLSRTEPTIDSCSDPFLFSETYVLRKGLKTVLTNRSTSFHHSSFVENSRLWKDPGLRDGPSPVWGNSYAGFREGDGAAMCCPYPTFFIFIEE